MRLACIPLVFTLAACEKNTFVVEDPGDSIRTATLQVCGSATPLERTGRTLHLTHAITCEGDGDIRLIFRDGAEEHCRVGYLDSDAKQKWTFTADEQFGCLQQKN